MPPECPRCNEPMVKGFIKDRSWMSGDGPRTIVLGDPLAAMITAWRCLKCGKIELAIAE